MVLQKLTYLLTDRYGCDAEDITMAASLDDLNITDEERCDLAALLWEMYVPTALPDEFPPFDTVEDLVGFIEDQMG
ncbi:MAG: hypothetical protein J6K62_03530 [Clostridia bacterium]|nr:hypothetical protein [Clostridia bacterium]